MAPRDLHNWAEDLESGRDNDPELQIAARLRSLPGQVMPAPHALKTNLRQRLLDSYDGDSELSEQLRMATPRTPTVPNNLRVGLHQRLMAQYDSDRELAARLQARRPVPVAPPLRLRLELRQRLLSFYSRPLTQKSKPWALRQFRVRFAIVVASILLVVGLSGGLAAPLATAERILNRIFVVDTPKSKLATPTPTSEQPDLTAVAEQTANAKQHERERTEIAILKKNGGVKTQDIEKVQKDLPFTIALPSSLPEGTLFEFLKRRDPKVRSAGIELRYRLPSNAPVIIYQSLPSYVENVQVDRSMVVRELSIHGNPAVLYNPDPSNAGGGPRLLILQWTDGERWFEIWSTADPEIMAKIARSMAP